MLNKEDCLKYYSREDILDEIVRCSENKEVGVRFADGHFGKRPDVILNNQDIIELVKQGVISFHISEEHWKNPMKLSVITSKNELDELRIGWDLILDIDCASWKLSKKICFVIVEILKKHNVESIYCKFSGNKGFHIAVPFSSFPEEIDNKESKCFFPDGVKKVLEYIVYCIKKEYSDFLLEGFNINEIAEELAVERSQIFKEFCLDCGEVFVNTNNKIRYNCSHCGHISEKEELLDAIKCEKCGFGMVKPENKKEQQCSKCKGKRIKKEINLELIIGLDNVLISSRHLYRMPFSLHEKSGLVSVPIKINKILEFEKEQAKPENIKEIFSFFSYEKNTNIKTVKKADAENFIFKVMNYKSEFSKFNEKNTEKDYLNKSFQKSENFNNKSKDKIPIECFPPSILNILKGIKDGRKRALFVLLNFLDCMNWGVTEIDIFIREWNKKNTPPLKDGLITTHLNYKKNNKTKVLPPNYSNNIYYLDLGIISSEEQSGKIKNPVTYAIRKSIYLKKDNKKVDNKN
jgi:ribosomal protein S27AE